MEKHWQLLEPDILDVGTLQKTLGVHPVTATILVNRQIRDKDRAMPFLQPTLQQLRSPFELKDMDLAVERVARAIDANQKILIFGDYDVDGVTATIVLYDFLSHAGADVTCYIPHRVDEGYGLRPRHIEEVAGPGSIELIITVDCGSASRDAVAKARRAGIDVIITDHHNVPDTPPGAIAFVNPKRTDCTAGLEHLAGVGVAFYLIISLRKYLRERDFWKNKAEPNLKSYCDLVSLGTVADLVPLVAENRVLTKTGLELINNGPRLGINALKQVSGMTDARADSGDIAFKLAPRLNAAGRLAHADMAMKLLCCTNADTAFRIARSLDDMNTRRRDAEKKIMDQAMGLIDQHPELLDYQTLTLAHPDWHEGILGIVASRIVDKFFRPVILISVRDGIGKGSARSIPGIDLYQGLCSCDADLESYGGHAMAAGLKISADGIADFRDHFEAAVSSSASDRDFTPTITIDAQLDFEDITDGLLDELESLKPFGAGNPEPLFMARNLEVSSSRIVGKHHRKMVLRQRSGPGARAIDAIHFNIDPSDAKKQYFEQMAFRVQWNHYKGNRTLQIVVEDT